LAKGLLSWWATEWWCCFIQLLLPEVALLWQQQQSVSTVLWQSAGVAVMPLYSVFQLSCWFIQGCLVEQGTLHRCGNMYL
jgi:hypothetical protein